MASAQGTRVDPTPTIEGISFTSALVRDYRHDMSEYDAFRAVITVPAGTQEVALWAEEPTEITIRGEQHTIDASRGIAVAPNGQGKVVVTLEADDVARPPLLLRTNAMQPAERFYVFPDADAHRKLAQLDSKALYENREALGISSDTTEADCENVAQAIKALSDTVRKTYDPSTGGLGQYETVADDEQSADWEVDVSQDRPTYRRLTAEAQAATTLTRIGGTLAQGKKKKGLGKTLGKAGKSAGKSVSKAGKSAGKTASKTGKAVSKTGKSAGKTVSKTGKAAGKAVSKTATSAGKAVGSAAKATNKAVHGAVIAAADITDDMAKIDALAKDGAKQMAKVIRKGTGQTIALAVKIGKQTLHFAIDSAKHLGAAIASIVKELGTSIKKMVKWLADLLGWDDILHTQKLLEDSFNQALDYLINTTKDAKKEVKALIGTLDKTINSGIDKAIAEYGGGMPKSKGRKDTIPSAVTDKVEWLLDQLSTGKNENDDDADDKSEPVGEDEAKSIGDVLASFVKTITDDPELKEALGGAMDQFVGIFEQPKQAPNLVLGIALNLLKALLNLLLSLVEGVVTLALDLAAKVLKLVRKLLNARLKIPFLSKLFKMITKGESLTLLNFMTLLIAVPVNMIGKAAGTIPFKGRGALGQSLSNKEWTEEQDKHDWGIVYGVCQFLGMSVVLNPYTETPEDFLSVWGLVLGGVSQIAGFPTGYPCFYGWSWGSTSGILANTIWMYQWLMLVVAAVTMNKSVEKSLGGGDGVTIVGAVMEMVHLGLFGALVATTKQDDRLDTSCIIDPLPGIFALSTIKPVKPTMVAAAASGVSLILKFTYGVLYLDATADHYASAKKKRKSE